MFLEQKSITTNSPEETFILAEQIAEYILQNINVNTNIIIALNGELGCGKTVFAKGLLNGLGIEDTITSPTYTIINEYRLTKEPFTNLPLYHIDLYRLNNDNDFFEIGGQEILDSGISIIEWAERIKNSLPENSIYITFEITGNTKREINIQGLS